MINHLRYVFLLIVIPVNQGRHRQSVYLLIVILIHHLVIIMTTIMATTTTMTTIRKMKGK